MNICPFPYFSAPNYEPQDGLLVPVPSFCKVKFRPKCKIYYQDISSKPGVHVCPYGFSSFVYKENDLNLIISCILITSHYDKKKLKSCSSNEDYLFKVPLPYVKMLAARTLILQNVLASQDRDLQETSSQNQRHQKFINSTIHEIRALNAEIISQSEKLSVTLDKFIASSERHLFDRACYLQKNIFATSSLISMRLNAYDFHENPNLVTGETPKDIPIYKKFDKISHCLHVHAREKDSRILFEGTCHATIRGYNVFEMLPFLLLDNALKFSPPDKKIHVTFFEKSPNLTITIASYGPSLARGEEQKIFETGYRGKNARDISTGSGLGLSLAQQVCNVHNITISARSDENLKSNGKYMFLVTLEFDPETLKFLISA